MVELFEYWIKKRERKRTTHFPKTSEGNEERYRTIVNILTELRYKILQNRIKLVIHSTVTFPKYVYPRELADIPYLYICIVHTVVLLQSLVGVIRPTQHANLLSQTQYIGNMFRW
jgi:hypothetical protein